jgi:hypothetical protein
MSDQKFTPETFELVYLNPHTSRFSYDGENLIYIDSQGAVYPRVTLRRCFPLSAQDNHILVRAPGGENDLGAELGVIEDVAALEPESRQAVQRELRLHYFVPTIQRIHRIREEFGFLYWSVDTDRGSKQFIMRDSVISSVRKISEGRWLIIDINQTRYEVRDFDQLDLQSQNLLKRYLLL